MKTSRVNKVEWLSQEDFISVWLKEGVDHFQVSSKIVLPRTELNNLLCVFQDQLEEAEVNDFMTVSSWSELGNHYAFDFEAANVMVRWPLESSLLNEARRICA